MSDTVSPPLSGAAIVTAAQQWLGVPYLYGGGRGSPAQARLSGVDCSGFVYQVFRSLGINPGTDTVSQFNNPAAVAVADLSQAQAGDLVFFGSPAGGTQEHVGIYIGHDLMIDAPHTGATVRLDPVSTFGEHILGIRRVTVPGGIAPQDPGGAGPAPAGGTAQLTSASSPTRTLSRIVVEVLAAGTGAALIVAGIYIATEPQRNKP